MATTGVLRTSARQVKPILSVNKEEARRRVLNLYKAWYRQLPYVVFEYDVPISVGQLQRKLREKFDENRHLTDIRVIDMQVIKGQMELMEVVKHFKQKHHIMNYFKDSQEPKPKDFLSKFLSGQD